VSKAVKPVVAKLSTYKHGHPSEQVRPQLHQSKAVVYERIGKHLEAPNEDAHHLIKNTCAYPCETTNINADLAPMTAFWGYKTSLNLTY